MKPRVNFIGIGAQKCASTWVHQVLNEHPQAFLSTPKELDYFSYFYGKGTDWYEAYFEAAVDARIVGDNSPSYFHCPRAPERAARYNPAMKIVVALRDPVERAYSNHLHMVRAGFLHGPDNSFEYGLGRNEMYLEQSRYATHLRRWLQHFPREQVFVVIQESLKTESAAVARQLYAFLGIDAGYAPDTLGERANESRVSTRPGLDSWLKRAARAGQAAGLGGVISNVKSMPMVRNLRRGASVDLRQMVPPMQDATRHELVRRLRPEMNELLALLQQDTLPWPSLRAPTPDTVVVGSAQAADHAP